MLTAIKVACVHNHCIKHNKRHSYAMDTLLAPGGSAEPLQKVYNSTIHLPMRIKYLTILENATKVQASLGIPPP